MNEIDFEQIIINVMSGGINEMTHYKCKIAMKEALRQAIPIILKDAADNAGTTVNKESTSIIVDKSSITAREEVLVKQFNLDK